MKIFFDYKIFLHQSSGGISRYIINLSKELHKINIQNHIVAPIHINKMLKEYAMNSSNIYGTYINQKPLYTNKILNLSNYFFTKLYLNKINPKIYHQTYYGKFPKLKKITRVITVHDLIHEKFHRYYGMPSNYRPKKHSLEKADKIICVSNSTKEDLIDFYNIDEKKIRVISHGHEHILKLTNNDNIINKNEILYVGGRGKYKNFKNLIKAFVLNKKINNCFKLVCFGGGSFNKNEINFFKENKIYEKIRHQDGDDKILANLYKTSACMIYPSLYEGFGLPIIESMAIGCPVIASNIKPIIETAGDAATYFDPKETDDLSQKLEKLLYQSDKTEIVNKGYQRVQKFKWKDCSLKTLSFYNE